MTTPDRRAVLLLAALLPLTACLSQPPADPPHLREFARLLELEDRRSLGGGDLERFLAVGNPPPVRERAALAAGRIGGPVARPGMLKGLLAADEPPLRRMAAFALGEMEDPAAVPLLLPALSDPDTRVRALAAEALGKLGDGSAGPAVEALIDDPDEEVAGMALLALWKLDPEDVAARAARVGRAYREGRQALRWRAAYHLMRALIRSPGETAFARDLVEASRDDDPLIRSFAARGLGVSSLPEAPRTVLPLTDDRDWRVRVNAFNALASRPPELPPELPPDAAESVRLWRRYEAGLADEHPSVPIAALGALATCPHPDARGRLVAALEHPVPRFRELAILGLARREGTGALPFLERLAEDQAWSVRARVAEAMRDTGPPPENSEAFSVLTDPDPRVRTVAVATMASFASPQWDARVAAALDDEDPYVRASALAAVAERPALAGPEPARIAQRAYERALEDASNDARLAALDALGATGDAGKSALESALRDPDYLVRRSAATLLRDRHGEDRFSEAGEPRVTRSTEDYLEAARRAARKVTATLRTRAGTIVMELHAADAPLTVDNFVNLARAGALDGLAFHRVVPNFVVQDGDPRGDGNGGPGWQIRCEINLHRYGTGAVGMALSGKDTGGSQYFITHSPQPHLDGGYTLFGQVVSGQEAVDRAIQGDPIDEVIVREEPGRS